MTKQDWSDFIEAFLTVLFTGGATYGALAGTEFPGWWVVTKALIPVTGAGILAGIRRVSAGRRLPTT